MAKFWQGLGKGLGIAITGVDLFIHGPAICETTPSHHTFGNIICELFLTRHVSLISTAFRFFRKLGKLSISGRKTPVIECHRCSLQQECIRMRTVHCSGC